MPLTDLDWLVIAACLLFNLIIGIYYRSKASRPTDSPPPPAQLPRPRRNRFFIPTRYRVV